MFPSEYHVFIVFLSVWINNVLHLSVSVFVCQILLTWTLVGTAILFLKTTQTNKESYITRILAFLMSQQFQLRVSMSTC